MSHKKNQEKAELSIYQQALKVARAKGGEARRNVARLSGDIRSFDKPDILIAAEGGKRIVGIEHFRVDHHIGKGKKVESKSARFSSNAERFRRRHEDAARRDALAEEAYRGFGDLISRAIREQSNACVDDIRTSLDAGLFGKDGRGHAFKLDVYRDRVAEINSSADVQLGFVIEFHTDLRGWFLNNGFHERKIAPGEFPVSLEVYDLLKRASAHVDWIVLAFCPLYGDEVRDAAIIRCCNGMFETSAARQGIIQTPYLGLGKETPFGRQDRQGEVEFGVGSDGIDYLVENTSEPMDPFELFNNAICGAAEALNLARKGKPFAATTSVQLAYDIAKDSLKHKNGDVEPQDVLKAIGRMDPSEKSARMENWRKHWLIDNVQLSFRLMRTKRFASQRFDRNAMKYNLDKLKKVDLRDVWPHEALDFTKWLSEEPNLAMLSSAVGIELELIETESSVGSFNVDIYAREAGTGRKVIIENQLEDTNHDHLGKVITYAAGKGAEVVIWVVARARDEHRQAIEWLNQHTDSDFGFFLVEIELWSIGVSLPAPRFNVVEQPNEWTKAIKLSEGLSETERVKLSYWTKYREVAQATPEFLKAFNPQKPSKDHWTTLRCGTSAYHIALLIDTQHGRIGIEFYAPDDKEIGHKAIDNTDLFEERLGLAATPFDAKKASGLRFYKDGCKIKNNEAAWPSFISEQLEWALAMKKLIAELGL